MKAQPVFFALGRLRRDRMAGSRKPGLYSDTLCQTNKKKKVQMGFFA
jgi:hypothetical protein